MKHARRRNPRTIPLAFRFHFNGRTYRLSLADGQSARFHEFHYHEEGWTSTDARIVRRGRALFLDQTSDGRDCDGRLATHYAARCSHADRAGFKPWRYADEKPCRIRFPRWTTLDRSQRDYAAEAAGY